MYDYLCTHARNGSHTKAYTQHISPHEVSSDHALSADAGCGSDPDMLSHVVLVYPSAIAAACSCCVRAIQSLSDEMGCFS